MRPECEYKDNVKMVYNCKIRVLKTYTKELSNPELLEYRRQVTYSVIYDAVGTRIAVRRVREDSEVSFIIY